MDGFELLSGVDALAVIVDLPEIFLELIASSSVLRQPWPWIDMVVLAYAIASRRYIIIFFIFLS